MVDYEKLYYKLLNAITESIEILEQTQDETEQEFINSNPDKDEIVRHFSQVKQKSHKIYTLNKPLE
ncbi:MAG: hypothetical protein IKW62_06600 [Clostridia bacterium]|nr:hypothetical protein [Clostridia bacterium]